LHEQELIFRIARPAVADALARLHIDAWRAAYRGLVPDPYLAQLDYVRRAERFRELLSKEAEDTHLVEIDGEVVGFVTLGLCRDEDLDRETTGEIWGIYLAPSRWRQGIGGELYRYGEQILAARGYREIVLWVFEANGQARRFYEAMGFVLDGAEKTLDFGVPLKVVRYRKSLPEADPIDGTLDLHAFNPRDVAELIPVYIEECRRQGIMQIRIVHGKGRGVLRRRVHAILSRLPEVVSYEPGGMGGGQWGATLVELKPLDQT